MKLFTPKGFKTWKAKSWIVQSYAIIVKTWKHGVAKNLACQALNKIVFRFWKLVYQVLTIIFFWSCLGRPSHENHNSLLGLSLKFGTPKGFKTWKAESWLVQSLLRLGNIKLGMPSLEQKRVRFQNWECQLLTVFHLSYQRVQNVISN